MCNLVEVFMYRINSVSFRGGSGESTGSPAYSRGVNTEVPKPQCPPEQPNCDTVNFRGRDSEKKHTALKWAIGLTGATALTIAGLAYAHKTNAISKLNDGWFKDFVKKAEPATKKCHEWCSTLKTKCTECWNKVKNVFDKNK